MPTVGVVCLRLAKSEQGDHELMDLHAFCIITHPQSVAIASDGIWSSELLNKSRTGHEIIETHWWKIRTFVPCQLRLQE